MKENHLHEWRIGQLSPERLERVLKGFLNKSSLYDTRRILYFFSSLPTFSYICLRSIFLVTQSMYAALFTQFHPFSFPTNRT